MFPTGPRCARPDRAQRAAFAARRFRPLPLVVATLGVAAATAAGAQENLSFESLDAAGAPMGWSAGGANIASDSAVAVDGRRSLRVTRSTVGSVARVTQRVPAAALRARGEQRVRLEAQVRSPPGVAAIWLRLDGQRGPLFLDSFGYGREPDAQPALTSGATGAGAAWHRYAVELPLPADVDELALGVSVRGAGTAWFDALELTVVATDSWPPAAPVAVRYVESALALMREHSLRRREIDWPELRRRALEHARGAKTAADAHVAVRFAARELGDRHSYLQSASVTRDLERSAVSNARTGAARAAPEGRRLGGLAYLRVPGFAGGSPAEQVEFAEELRSLVQLHDAEAPCGWVVDLRPNSGGNLWPMLAGLGPLLGEGELAASVYPDGRRVAVWHRDGQAGFGDYTQLRVRAPYRLRATVPVAVLLGPGTASSAEVLAVAFRSRPATRSFGAPTRGLSAGNRTFPLADGAALVLTVAATSDPAGEVLMGPLVPDVRVPAGGADGTAPAADAALEAATGWLTAGDSCR
jgi:hypothetical protein